MDPYELLEAVEILSKMPKDFYEKIVRSGVPGAVLCPPAWRRTGALTLSSALSTGGQEVAREEGGPGGSGGSGQEPQAGGWRLRRPGQSPEEGKRGCCWTA